jgi:aryl-alcohol dehydrogenase-like predicted oxidoreductase
MRWPAKAEYPVGDAYPPDHIRQFTEKSLNNLDVEAIDLQHFHIWSDSWAEDSGWRGAIESLKREKLVHAFGISVN